LYLDFKSSREALGAHNLFKRRGLTCELLSNGAFGVGLEGCSVLQSMQNDIGVPAASSVFGKPVAFGPQEARLRCYIGLVSAVEPVATIYSIRGNWGNTTEQRLE